MCIIFRIPRVSHIFALLLLALLNRITSRSNHVAANGIISFFFWLNCGPLCVCTTSGLSIQLLMDTWVAFWLLHTVLL